jgi:hypothetical protein
MDYQINNIIKLINNNIINLIFKALVMLALYSNLENLHTHRCLILNIKKKKEIIIN